MPRARSNFLATSLAAVCVFGLPDAVRAQGVGGAVRYDCNETQSEWSQEECEDNYRSYGRPGSSASYGVAVGTSNAKSWNMMYTPPGGVNHYSSRPVEEITKQVFRLQILNWPPTIPTPGCEAEFAACAASGAGDHCGTEAEELARRICHVTETVLKIPPQTHIVDAPKIIGAFASQPTSVAHEAFPAVDPAGLGRAGGAYLRTSGGRFLRYETAPCGEGWEGTGEEPPGCNWAEIKKSATRQPASVPGVTNLTVDELVDRKDFFRCEPGFWLKLGTSYIDEPCEQALKLTMRVSTFTQFKGQCPEGNPCYPSSGNKGVDEVDFRFGSLEFKRHYNSQRQLPNFGGFDKNWSHPFSARVITQWLTNHHNVPAGPVNGSSDEVYVQDENTQLEVFVRTQTGLFRSSLDPNRALECLPASQPFFDPATGCVWRLTDGNGKSEIYDFFGRIREIRYADQPTRSLQIKYLVPDLVTQAQAYEGWQRTPFARVDEVTDGTGRGIKFEYEQFDPRVKRIRALHTNRLLATYEYDSVGRLWKADVGGKIREYKYAESGLVAEPYLIYHLTGIIDENGDRYATYTYDEHGRVTSSEHAGGAGRVELSYISLDEVEVTRPNGEVVTHHYDSSANGHRHRQTTEISDHRGPGGAATSVQFAYNGINQGCVAYDADDQRLCRTIDRRNTITERVYDAQKLTRLMEAKGTPEERWTDFAYGSASAGFRPTLADVKTPAGVVHSRSTWSYNGRGQIATRARVHPTLATSRALTYTYCEAADVSNPAMHCPTVGLLRQVDGSRTDVADVTTLQYYTSDAVNGHYRIGDVRKIINALGHEIEFLEYDDAGRVLRWQDANDTETVYQYNARGAISSIRVKDAVSGDAVTTFAYDDVGQLTSVTDPMSVTFTISYDDAHRPTRLTAPNGDYVLRTLDDMGNVTEVAYFDQSNVRYARSRAEFDTLGRLIRTLTAADDATEFSYDANGNVTSIEDALGREEEQEFDSLDRLISQSAPDAGTTHLTYSVLDDIVSVTDAKSLVTTYMRDLSDNGAFGDLDELSSPDTGSTELTYDSAGNVASRELANGNTEAISYDALNRPTGKTYLTAGLNIAYTYDVSHAQCPATAVYAAGRLSSISDQAGTTKICYDRRGNVIKRWVNRLGSDETITWSYDLANRVSTVTYPSGYQVNYSYDANGRTGTVSGSSMYLQQQYEPFGPVRTTTFGMGLQYLANAYLYDENYRPIQVTTVDALGAPIPGAHQIELTYDEVGNVASIAEDGALTESYGYDDQGRLTSTDVLSTPDSQSFTYDGVGNRLSKSVNAVTEVYIYPTTSHRLQSVAGITRTYDGAGNTLTGLKAPDGLPMTLAYDARNRLSQANVSTGYVSFVYAAGGERVFKERNLSTEARRGTQFVYDEQGRLIAERSHDWSGSAWTTPSQWIDYVYVGERLVAIHIAGAVRYVSSDHLQTPRSVFSSSGQTLWRSKLTNNAFYETQPDQDVDQDNKLYVVNHRFPGQYFDRETGLSYNYFRDYESTIGRYVESDPIGLGGGLNTFEYAASSPLAYFDPFGLEIYRGPNNYFSDSRPGAGCQVATMIGEYIFGWKPCPPPKSAPNCPIEAEPEPIRLLEGNIADASFDWEGALWEMIKPDYTMVLGAVGKTGKFWKALKAFRAGVKFQGYGKKRRYFYWDHTHKDLEVFDHKGRHLGSADPETGLMTKGPKHGDIDL